MNRDVLQNRLVATFKLLNEPQDNWTYADWNDWNTRRKEWVSQINDVMPIHNYPIKQTYDDYNHEDEQPGACCGCE